MRQLLIAAAVTVAALGQGGCITASLAKMTPEQQSGLIKALGEAGCYGSLRVGGSAGTAAGVSPGQAQGSFDFNGGCDPLRVKSGVPSPAMPGTSINPTTFAAPPAPPPT